MAGEIRGFQGTFRFLSNFYPCQIINDGLKFPTVEHAYQAEKTSDARMKKMISIASSPSIAKKMGKTVVMVPDWEEKKIGVMYDLLVQKFSKEHFRNLLLETGNARIIEENTWGDTFWGVCNGKGENNLGEILMFIRSQLAESSIDATSL